MWAMRWALPLLFSLWLMAMVCMLKVHGYLERASWDMKDALGWITLKYEPAGYVVQLQFDNNCKVKEKYEFFNNTIAALLESNGIGPDEVVVQLEGPSIQAKVATLTSKDTCNEYEAIFQVPRDGVYRLKITRLHRNYMGSRDDLSKVAKIEMETLVDEEIKDTMDSYMPNPCDSRTSGYWVRRRTGNAEVDSSGNYFLDRRVVLNDNCPMNRGVHRGLPVKTHIGVSRNFEKNECAYDIDLYSWNHKICQPGIGLNSGDGDIVEYGHPNITEISREWFANKKILFIGDSHMEGLADLFATHVCKYDKDEFTKRTNDVPLVTLEISQKYEKYLTQQAKFYEVEFSKDEYAAFRADIDECRSKYTNVEECEVYKAVKDPKKRRNLSACFQDLNSPACDLFHYECTGSTIAYLGAMYCQKGIPTFMDGYDYVIMNCGHHFAKHAFYDYELYSDVMRDLAIGLKDLVYSGNHRTRGDQKNHYFYLESVAPPLQEDENKIHDADLRTLHRLMIYDSIAFQQLKKYFNAELINRIPAFSSTLAMYDKMCDCTHYPWGAKMPQLLALTDKLKRSHQLRMKAAAKAVDKAEDIEISINERAMASSIARETSTTVEEAERKHSIENTATDKDMEKSVEAVASMEARSDEYNHKADTILIEKATAQSLEAEMPTHPDGVGLKPIFPRKAPIKRKHDTTLYAEVDFGV